MRRARPALALAAALAAAGCVYTPEGSCESSADCAAGQQCSAGVCVAPSAALGDGDDPSFAPALWTTLDAATGATFRVGSVGADLDGNVVVAGTVDAAYTFDPAANVSVATGAFAVKRDALDGTARWAFSFATFVEDSVRTAVLPDGAVFFAGNAFDPTTIGTALSVVPPTRGALVVGQLDRDGVPVWARAIGNTHATADFVPAAVAVSAAGDLLVAGTGSGNFDPASASSCDVDTASATFVAALSGSDGSCRWSRGFGTRTLAGLAPREDGAVAVAGICAPAGASFDPGGGTSCTKGLFVAVLDGSGASAGSTRWARIGSGTGTVAAVSDLAVAPDGSVTVIGDASGVVDFGRGPIDFGLSQGSFAAIWDPSGVATALVRPVESPYGTERDELAFSRCSYDRGGALWIAGRYAGRPELGGVRFTGCRAPECGAAAFLAALDRRGQTTSFLPIRAAPAPDGGAYADELAVFATSGTVAAALRFTGAAVASPVAGEPAWPAAAAGLGVLRLAPP